MKKGRRAKGSGSIFQRDSDGLWVGTAELPREGGKRRRKPVYGKTEREVVEKLLAIQSKVAAALPVPDERVTVEKYLRWWLAEVVPGTVKDSTLDSYTYVAERYVIPHVGRVRLARLLPEHVNSMLRALEKDGRSPRTRQYARAVLRRALREAERWGRVERNAAALVDSPRGGGAKLDDALELEEAEALLGAASGDRLEAAVRVALAVGLRRGETLGLQIHDIDLDAETLTVRRTLRRRTGVGLVVDAPKSLKGLRTVPLPKVCVRALREHLRRRAAERLAAGPAWQETGYLFTTPIGTPIDPRNLTRHYHAITERAGLGTRRFHALRHSCATIMLAMGVPLEVISATLGHSGLAITADVYARVGPKLQRQAAEAMDRALGSSS